MQPMSRKISWYCSMCAKIDKENLAFESEKKEREANRPKVVVKDKKEEAVSSKTEKKQPIIERKKG